MKKVRIGFQGIGFITDWHFRAFAKLEGAEVCAISRDYYGTAEQMIEQKARLSAKAEELGLSAYDSYDAMLADPDIDAVMLGSINPLHYEQIMAALHAGKHVLVEKPVVTDISQLTGIEALSRQTERVVFPAHNFAYREAVLKAKAVLDSGRLGKLIFSSFVITHTTSDAHAAGWRASRELGSGGTLMDSGHHLVYQTLYLLGRPERISAFTASRVRIGMECEDLAQVGLQYADGSVCTVLQSIASDHGEGVNGIRIVGDQGNLIITDALYVNGERIEATTDYQASFDGQAAAFVDAVLNGTPPVSSLADAKDTLAIIYSAYQSVEKGCTVSLV